MTKMTALFSVLLISLLAACSAPAAPSPSVVPPSPTAAALEKVTIVEAPVPLMSFLPFDVAQALDLYKQEGLEVSVQHLGGVEATAALAAGSVDFVTGDPAITAQAQGQALPMVVLVTRYPGATLIVRSDMKDKIKSVADLKGQKIGVSGSPGTFAHRLGQYLIAKAGLTPNDVQFITGGSVSRVNDAMLAGDTAAAMSLDPYTTEITQPGKAFALVDLTTEVDAVKYLGGEYPVGVETSMALIKNRPQAVHKMANVLVKALQYIGTHPAEEIAALVQSSASADGRALYIAALQHSLASFSKDGIVTEGGVKNAIAVNKALGAIKPDQPIDVSALFTTDFVNRAN